MAQKYPIHNSNKRNKLLNVITHEMWKLVLESPCLTLYIFILEHDKYYDDVNFSKLII